MHVDLTTVGDRSRLVLTPKTSKDVAGDPAVRSTHQGRMGTSLGLLRPEPAS